MMTTINRMRWQHRTEKLSSQNGSCTAPHTLDVRSLLWCVRFEMVFPFRWHIQRTLICNVAGMCWGIMHKMNIEPARPMHTQYTFKWNMEIKLVFAIFNNIEYGEAVCNGQTERERETGRTKEDPSQAVEVWDCWKPRPQTAFLHNILATGSSAHARSAH